MAINYLYIDDDSNNTLESLSTNVSITDKLKIDFSNPSDFQNDDNNLENLINALGNYQGLILDWRLDKIPNNGKHFRFRAGSVAQEIRIRQAEGSVVNIPIVLWSTNENLQGSYTSDKASHDLFDEQHDKTKISDRAEQISIELITLSKGYTDIKNNIDDQGKLNQSIFRLNIEYFQYLPKSFVEFVKQLIDMSVHDYARIFLKEIITKPGVLINEKLLAAKLGIDIEQSSDWSALLESLKQFKYEGPFHDAHIRWWWHLINKKWWNEYLGATFSLQSVDADERVKSIIELSGFKNLTNASGIEMNYQTNFQTICEYYQKPLDTVDGVTIKEKEPYMWQEKRYLSLKAALERRGFEEGLRPHPVEIDRLQLMNQN